MCHNHSHLIAGFLGEDTSYSLPVLTYLLVDPLLKVESPQKDGGLIVVKTSGTLMLPSMMLGGYSALHQPQTEAERMSLFCLPEGATTTILKAAWVWLSASAKSLEASDATGRPLPATLRSEDEGDAPF